MAKDWSKDKSAMEMTVQAMEEKKRAEYESDRAKELERLNEEHAFLQSVSSDLEAIIFRLREREVEGVEMYLRSDTIETLRMSEGMMQRMIIETRKRIKHA